MKKLIIAILTITTLAGCSDSNHNDIKLWMGEQEKQLKGKIELLPAAKSYTPVVFKAELDPFVVKEKLSLNELIKDRYAPDLKREKEYLEGFNLEALKMVGTIIKDGQFYAMILDTNKSINYISVGNYIGQNYGKVTSVNEGEVLIEERINNNDQWVVRNARMQLYEGSQK
jgi:type IV pilus assembly protein PilP